MLVAQGIHEGALFPVVALPGSRLTAMDADMVQKVIIVLEHKLKAANVRLESAQQQLLAIPRYAATPSTHCVTTITAHLHTYDTAENSARAVRRKSRFR